MQVSGWRRPSFSRFRVNECVLSDSTDKVVAFGCHGARRCRDQCVWLVEIRRA